MTLKSKSAVILCWCTFLLASYDARDCIEFLFARDFTLVCGTANAAVASELLKKPYSPFV